MVSSGFGALGISYTEDRGGLGRLIGNTNVCITSWLVRC